MALAGFAPTGYTSVTALPATAVVALPGGGGATLLVTNLGDSPAVVLLQNSSTVPSPFNSSLGVVVMPRVPLALTVGSNTYLAYASIGNSAQLNLVQGT